MHCPNLVDKFTQLSPFELNLLMNGRMHMDEWKNGWMEDWMNGWMDEWMNGRMEEWKNGRMDEWMNGRMDE